jgi:hypothetical protein
MGLVWEVVSGWVPVAMVLLNPYPTPEPKVAPIEKTIASRRTETLGGFGSPLGGGGKPFVFDTIGLVSFLPKRGDT